MHECAHPLRPRLATDRLHLLVGHGLLAAVAQTARAKHLDEVCPL